MGEHRAAAKVGQRHLHVASAAHRVRPPILVIPISPPEALPWVPALERDLALVDAGEAALRQHAPAGCPLEEVLPLLLREQLLIAQN